jgi:hypothetical protein
VRTVLYEVNSCISKLSHMPPLIFQIKENMLILHEINSEILWPQIWKVEYENFGRYMNVKPVTVIARSEA